MTDSEVIVVGAGPTGMLTALGLARAGVDVTVIERSPEIVESPRAMTYLWFVLDGLEQLGLLEDMENTGVIANEGMNLRIFKTGEQINHNFGILEAVTDRPYNVLLGQGALAQLAHDHLVTHENARVLFGVEVLSVTQDEDTVQLQISDGEGERSMAARWVIGADGANSIVRRSFHGDTFDGITWPERFIATNVMYPFPDYDYKRANLVVDDHYGAVVALIDRSNAWRVTYSENADLPEDSIEERMSVFFDGLLEGQRREIELLDYSPYRMHQRAAPSMRMGRALLAGDAAHITNPTGGLGLTCGLIDSFTLYPLLADVIGGRTSADALDGYSEQRLQAFNRFASPAASELKKTVYHTPAGPELDARLAPMRALAGDPEMRMKMFLEGANNLRGPALPAWTLRAGRH